LDSTETISGSAKTIPDLVGTIPSLINHHTMFPNISKTISSIEIQVCYPMVRECYRRYRELSPVNDRQSDLEIRDDPYAFYKVLLVVEPQASMYLSLCFADTSITKDLIIGIPNTLFNLIIGYCHLLVP
jgi:hypothetical protein